MKHVPVSQLRNVPVSLVNRDNTCLNDAVSTIPSCVSQQYLLSLSFLTLWHVLVT